MSMGVYADELTTEELGVVLYVIGGLFIGAVMGTMFFGHHSDLDIDCLIQCNNETQHQQVGGCLYKCSHKSPLEHSNSFINSSLLSIYIDGGEESPEEKW